MYIMYIYVIYIYIFIYIYIYIYIYIHVGSKYIFYAPYWQHRLLVKVTSLAFIKFAKAIISDIIDII